MTQLFADRGQVIINGQLLLYCKSVKCTIDESISQADHMSADYLGSGFKRANKKVSGSFDMDIAQDKAQVDLALALGKDIAVKFVFGGESWTIKSIVQNTQDLNGSVGDAGKTINFLALNAVNENGAVANSTYGL